MERSGTEPSPRSLLVLCPCLGHHLLFDFSQMFHIHIPTGTSSCFDKLRDNELIQLINGQCNIGFLNWLKVAQVDFGRGDGGMAHDSLGHIPGKSHPVDEGDDVGVPQRPRHQDGWCIGMHMIGSSFLRKHYCQLFNCLNPGLLVL